MPARNSHSRVFSPALGRARNWLAVTFWTGLRSQLTRAAGIYLVTYAISLGVPFLLLPIMTYYIQPQGYGHLAMFQMLMAIACGIIGFSLRNPLISTFSVKEPREQARFLSSCLVIMGTLFVIVLGAASLAHSSISSLTDLSILWIIVAVVAGLALALNQVNFILLQSTHRPGVYAATQIAFSMLNAVISIFLVVGLHTEWSGRAVAAALVAIISGGWAFLRLLDLKLLGPVNRADLKDAFTFGAAAIPYTLSTILLVYTDRIFLSAMFSFRDVGLYSVAAHLAQGFVACGSALNLAIIPWAYRQLAQLNTLPDLILLAKRMAFYIVAMAFLALIFFVAISAVARILMPPQYAAALTYFSWLVAGGCCQCLFGALSVVLFHYPRRGLLSAFGIGALLCSMGLIYGLSSALGPIGAAIGLFLDRLLLLLVVLAVAAYLTISHIRQTQTAAAS